MGDTTIASSADVTLVSGAVSRVVLLGVADLDASGNDAANGLTGNSGANLLIGGGGNDTLTGGLATTPSSAAQAPTASRAAMAHATWPAMQRPQRACAPS